jgi:hypothetical protein
MPCHVSCLTYTEHQTRDVDVGLHDTLGAVCDTSAIRCRQARLRVLDALIPTHVGQHMYKLFDLHALLLLLKDGVDLRVAVVHLREVWLWL